MNKEQIETALEYCCDASPITCRYCVLWEHKYNGDGTYNFNCSSNGYWQQTKLHIALEKVIRENPNMFPLELVARVCKARVV